MGAPDLGCPSLFVLADMARHKSAQIRKNGGESDPLFAISTFPLPIEHMFDRLSAPNEAERWRAQYSWNS